VSLSLSLSLSLSVAARFDGVRLGIVADVDWLRLRARKSASEEEVRKDGGGGCLADILLQPGSSS